MCSNAPTFSHLTHLLPHHIITSSPTIFSSFHPLISSSHLLNLLILSYHLLIPHPPGDPVKAKSIKCHGLMHKLSPNKAYDRINGPPPYLDVLLQREQEMTIKMMSRKNKMKSKIGTVKK